MKATSVRAWRSLFAVVALTFSIAALSVGLRQTEYEKPIIQKLRTLRSLSDSDRVVATKQLALQIRALPAGTTKVGLANALANVSTEGDFGHDTLQEVATTLAMSLKEDRSSADSSLESAYDELAQLVRFEHVHASLDSPGYAAAVGKLDKTEKERARATFSLTDIEGRSWNLANLRGKVVLVNFWATWCPPCRKEMPDLETLYNRFKNRGFVVLAISDETEAKVKPFIAQHQFDFPVLLDPGRTVNTSYHVEGIPKSFIYNRKGKLVAETIDMRTQGQFLALLAQAGLK